MAGLRRFPRNSAELLAFFRSYWADPPDGAQPRDLHLFFGKLLAALWDNYDILGEMCKMPFSTSACYARCLYVLVDSNKATYVARLPAIPTFAPWLNDALTHFAHGPDDYTAKCLLRMVPWLTDCRAISPQHLLGSRMYPAAIAHYSCTNCDLLMPHVEAVIRALCAMHASMMAPHIDVATLILCNMVEVAPLRLANALLRRPSGWALLRPLPVQRLWPMASCIAAKAKDMTPAGPRVGPSKLLYRLFCDNPSRAVRSGILTTACLEGNAEWPAPADGIAIAVVDMHTTVYSMCRSETFDVAHERYLLASPRAVMQALYRHDVAGPRMRKMVRWYKRRSIVVPAALLRKRRESHGDAKRVKGEQPCEALLQLLCDPEWAMLKLIVAYI